MVILCCERWHKTYLWIIRTWTSFWKTCMRHCLPLMALDLLLRR